MFLDLTFNAILVRFRATACNIVLGEISEALPILRNLDPGWRTIILDKSIIPASAVAVSNSPQGIDIFVSKILYPKVVLVIFVGKVLEGKIFHKLIP